MACIQIVGGLGNQMFQYAFGRYVSIETNSKLIMDISLLEKDIEGVTKWEFGMSIFNFHADIGSEKNLKPFRQSFLIKLFKKLVYLISIGKINDSQFLTESDFEKDQRLFLRKSHRKTIVGYWQSEDYFRIAESEIRNDLKFINKLSKRNSDLKDSIVSTNSVSIHIRRGDYISNKGANKTHGTCSPDYYVRAIDYLTSKISDPYFYFFSDDINWVKDNFKLDFQHKLIDWNHGKESYIDMQMMSYCKHNIIANSSFSWWGAWLNDNSVKIVVAPKIWFRDKVKNKKANKILPDSWIRL
jgi:hypothetical protein